MLVIAILQSLFLVILLICMFFLSLLIHIQAPSQDRFPLFSLPSSRSSQSLLQDAPPSSLDCMPLLFLSFIGHFFGDSL